MTSLAARVRGPALAAAPVLRRLGVRQVVQAVTVAVALRVMGRDGA